MTVGQPVDLSAFDVEHYAVLRAELRSGDLPHLGDRLWGRTRFALHRSGEADILPSLLSRHHAADLADAGEGPEAVGIPFAHLAILTGESTAGWGDPAERIVEEAFGRHFGNMVDPINGVRVSIATGREHGPDQMSVYFGYGVFVPHMTDEAPVGALEIRPLIGADRTPIIPRLADGRPAAFYRGQRGLAFAEDETLAPATAPGLDPDHVFYLGRHPGDEQSRKGTVLGFGCFRKRGEGPVAIAARPLAAPEVPTGWDGAFRLSRHGQEIADVVYVADCRPGARLAADALGARLRIVGIVDPAASLAATPARWWVDLDRHGHLASSPLICRAVSHVIESGRQRVFDWARFTYVGRAGRLGGQASRDATPLTVLMPESAGTDFGAVGVPNAAARLAFDARALARGRMPLLLDWLDHAVAVEPLGSGVLGLAAALGADFALDIDPVERGHRVSGRGLAVARPGSMEFRSTQTATLAEGDRVVIGPLLLEYSAT